MNRPGAAINRLLELASAQESFSEPWINDPPADVADVLVVLHYIDELEWMRSELEK